MIVADTSVWIEYFRKRGHCYTHVSELMEVSGLLASEAVFGELLQGARDDKERRTISEHWEHLPKWEESGIFIKAGEESGRQKWLNIGLGLIDSAVILLARETHSQVWTLDKKMMSVLKPGETYRLPV